MSHRFVDYLVGLSLEQIGAAVIYIALPFMVIQQGTASEKTIALIVGVGSAARICAPLIGHVVDAIGPALVMTAASVITVVIFGSMVVVKPHGLVAVVILAAVGGLVSASLTTAGGSAIPRLVSAEALGRANALNAVALMGIPVAGYSLAGVIIAARGVYFALGVAVVLALPLIAISFLLPGKLESVNTEEGHHHLGAVPLWLALLSGCALLMNIVINITNVRSPLYFNDIGLGARGYGYFEAILGAGLVVGLAVGAVFSRRWPSVLLVGATALMVAGSLVTYLPHVASWYAFGALLGLGMGAGQVMSATLVQERSPHHRLGRYMGLLTAVGSLGLILGSFVGGTHVGVSLLLVATSVPLLVVAGWFALTLHRERGGIGHSQVDALG